MKMKKNEVVPGLRKLPAKWPDKRTDRVVRYTVAWESDPHYPEWYLFDHLEGEPVTIDDSGVWAAFRAKNAAQAEADRLNSTPEERGRCYIKLSDGSVAIQARPVPPSLERELKRATARKVKTASSSNGC